MKHALTLGVEEEFFVVDATGHLSGRAGEIVESAEGREGELQRELDRSQVELATGICRTHDDVLSKVQDLRRELAVAAAGRGLRLVPSGTVPMAEEHPPGITLEGRYQRMADHFGATPRTVRTCGCHVHVAMPDPAAGIQVINHVRPWLPLLLAITANSPIEGGIDTGYCSWRYQQWTQWPSAGPPPRFDSVDHYESIVDGWLRAGAILDRGMVYWDIRLSEKQPTLEFRIADVATTAEEATLLAVLVRGLTHVALNEDEPAPMLSNEVLRGQVWRASRDGLRGRCPHPGTGDLLPATAVLDDLFGALTPVLREHGDFDFAKQVISRLHGSGGGADRQREAFGTAHRAEDVVDLLAVPADPM
ncbi:glutamate--cysteine ligase [Actinocrispum sp. NPDC049592]|uniref:carboxylate-amine ligase n=1 Tax=Actinocrispum sp. NPDC049592 TaxID=3154835 RepID=UPI0034343B8E